MRRLKKIVFFEVEGDQAQVAQTIVPEIEIRGVRFWFLLCSCVIASVGLNTNSAAVIIGAMLVSPLMGPILGLGFGLAIRSRKITIEAARNLTWATGASLLLSTFYFILSPLNDATPEILARTAPTLLDLMVAMAAAFAGVIAFTSHGTSAIVPGVAIATAIMPPLCASGYGISQGDVRIAFGAFYLFLINAIAIATVAFLLFKRMQFHETREDIEQKTTLPKIGISAVLIVFLTPLTWTLWSIWKSNEVQREVRSLIAENRDRLEIVNWQFENTSPPKLTIYLFKEASPTDHDLLKQELNRIQPEAKLVLRHTAESSETRDLIAKLKSSPLYPALSDSALLRKFIQPQTEEIKQPQAPELAQTEAELKAIVGSHFDIAFYTRDPSLKEMLVLVAPASPAKTKERSVKKPQRLALSIRKDMENRIQAWAKNRGIAQSRLEIVWR